MAIQTFAPTVGGAELQLERLLPRLAARGIEADVLTRAADGRPPRERVAGGVVRRTPVAGESPVASIAYVVGGLAHIVRRRARLDVVHAHGALSPATIALGASAIGMPSLVTVLGTGPHGDLARLARKPAGRLRGRLLFRRARFVALSAEARAELLARDVEPDRIFTIPNGVDGEVFRPATAEERVGLRARLGLPRERFVGTFVGRLHPVKDLDTLLAAAVLAPRLELLVVGDGPDRARLERAAIELGVSGRVRWAGFSPRVADLLRASDAFLLCSHGEGMSNALLEAMACGLACVATTSVGGVRELLGDGRGLVVPPGDAAAWADAVGRLADDEALRAALGEAAARFAARSLTLDAAADRLAAAYRAVSRRASPR
jgi:glycosyltransferase involved in cell wall biosynthesis